MMLRFFLVLLFAATLLARASEPITAKYGGASGEVQQPHVTAELIPETLAPVFAGGGKPFDIILHLHADPGWHTYWINPGEAGLATTIKWTLPEGYTAGPIQWPTPEKHSMGGIMTFGYEGDVYLITTITPPKSGGTGQFEIKARASWLVCQEACIPGKGDFSLKFNVYDDQVPGRDTVVVFGNKEFFKAARERLPVANTRWDVTATYAANAGGTPLRLEFANKPGMAETTLGNLTFFPEQPNVLDPIRSISPHPDDKSAEFVIKTALQQNGEKPDQLSGVLVSDQPLIGTARAVYISEFKFPTDGEGKETASPPPATDSGPVTASAAAPNSEAPPPQTLLILVLGAAFIGGLILNLMPCVLPVLSLKVFSLMKHAGDDPRGAWKQGAAFTAGVVLSFWVLAGLLLILRGVGNQLGWGFQMQSPGFVLGLIILFFLLALNLFGLFEIGTSLVGLDARTTGKFHGLTSSFFNGALATLAATPCTGPFMGSSLGFAAQQPWYVALLIFTFLALGMASPYLLLTIFPAALKRVPKPGAWMESFKQLMGFILMLTVIWLVSVYGSLAGAAQVPGLLAGLLAVSMAAWIYSKWGVVRMLAFVAIVGGAVWLLQTKEQKWEPWSPDAVEKALASNRPVFVDFTADWCLSCKVNERVALSTDAVHKAFADKNVVLLKADWTQSDPEISKTLQAFNRDGVPLYLLYSPKDKAKPQVLPAVLTPGIVLDAIKKL